MDAIDKEALEYKDPVDDELEQDMADMEFYDLAHSMDYAFDEEAVPQMGDSDMPH